MMRRAVVFIAGCLAGLALAGCEGEDLAGQPADGAMDSVSSVDSRADASPRPDTGSGVVIAPDTALGGPDTAAGDDTDGGPTFDTIAVPEDTAATEDSSTGDDSSATIVDTVVDDDTSTTTVDTVVDEDTSTTTVDTVTAADTSLAADTGSLMDSGPLDDTTTDTVDDLDTSQGADTTVAVDTTTLQDTTTPLDTAASVDTTQPPCGNGALDPGETCDPPGSCPTACDDLDACTDDVLLGDPAQCTSECISAPIDWCAAGDGCCPGGCDVTSDLDCPLDCRDATTWPPLWAQWEQEVLYWTNAYRTGAEPGAGVTVQDCGTKGTFPVRAPLTYDTRLAEAARCHSMDMALNDFFDHIGTGGTSLPDRVAVVGYSWWGLAENIGGGYLSPEAAVIGWMDSDPHCANVMNGSLTELGAGYVRRLGTTWTNYWTQDLGKPRQ